jgi:hypothetical protein
LLLLRPLKLFSGVSELYLIDAVIFLKASEFNKLEFTRFIEKILFETSPIRNIAISVSFISFLLSNPFFMICVEDSRLCYKIMGKKPDENEIT